MRTVQLYAETLVPEKTPDGEYVLKHYVTTVEVMEEMWVEYPDHVQEYARASLVDSHVAGLAEHGHHYPPEAVTCLSRVYDMGEPEEES